MEILQSLKGEKIIAIYNNYIQQSLKINFEDNESIIFNGCVLTIDTGIIGHIISYVSNTGTLGMALELKRMNQDPDDFNFVILSRDIKDLEQKNELLISYKQMEWSKLL
ncbi:hypothetical protein Emtol_1869 [Emticicia oligotrophica DSM 17448]|uniref:Uncharacterized protein n=1 Tax=Emticicia oligotrophica (strain DSM 17448 / CIP 109782 / MTCC 6937 / GPTSA100-15) TaxID=929562 RepID=A0ABM5N0R2_EMTOG|nr:hypothetical protein [Emticicia oligotrophica]AFK03011.1 hypothetical protein Emtol_1869 [Emticicia oligotrophica DSM 17448]